MKWLSDPLRHRADEVRVVRKFLWLPKCINEEWRWLESATIKQMVCSVDVGGSMQWGYTKHKWLDMEWVG